MRAYAETVAVVALATMLAWAMFPYLEASNLVMAYLLGVIVVARRHGRGPSVGASVLSVVAFDYFFVPPYYHLAVSDTRSVITFAIMLIVALVISGLTIRVHTNAEAVRLEQTRSALLSSVSHDLRTPLAAITGAVSTVLERGDRLDAATRRELLESARDEAERLNRLVQNLLQMTRLEADTLQLRTEWHPIEEVVGAALGRLARQIDGRAVVTSIPEDLPLVAIDGLLIEQALINLLDNALKYSPPGSPVGIAVARANGTIAVEVSDRGPGLTSVDAARVFEKFYRSATSGTPGAGLGLAICQAIVRAHGGEIAAGNRPDGGLAVRFTLPVGDAPRVATHE